MALLKDLIVTGASKFIGDAYFNLIKSGTWNGTAIDLAHGGTAGTTTANKMLVSTTTNGTSKWSDWSTAGFLKTSNTGVISVDTTVLTTASSLDPSKLSSAVPVNKGGTNITSWTAFSIPYASAATTISLVSPNTTATKKFLRMTGTGSAGSAPTWDTLVADDIPNLNVSKLTAGTLSVERGGTGQTSVANIQAGKDGNGNTITSTYATKATAITDVGIYTGKNADKDTTKSITTNGDVYIKMNKTINGSETLDSQVKIKGDLNATVTTDSDGSIVVKGPAVTESSFTVSGTVYTLKSVNNTISISRFVAGTLSAAFSATSLSSTGGGNIRYNGSVASSATATPSNTITVTVTPGTLKIKITSIVVTKGSNSTTINSGTGINTEYTSNQTLTFTVTGNGAAELKTASKTLTANDKSVSSGSTDAQSATINYTLDGTAKTATCSIASTSKSVSVTVLKYSKKKVGSGSYADVTSYSSRPTSLTFTGGNGECYFAYPKTWGTAEFVYSLGTDDSWAVLSDTTLDGVTYTVYKHADAKQDYSWTVKLTGGTAF